MTIGRRQFLSALGGALVMQPLAAPAQNVVKSYRLAFLALRTGQESEVVKLRLEELGYAEGKNLVFDFHSADGQPERLAALATELVRTNPDVIVTGFGTLTAKAAQAATATIPVVFTTVGDPIGAGIVKSLNRPGANITGLTDQASEITGKRLQIMQPLQSGIQIVAVLMNPDTPFSALALQDLRAAGGPRLVKAYLERRATTHLVINIALLPQQRGRGLGTALMEWVCALAHAAGKSVTVAVEKNNRAQTLYRRLGFREIADRGVHWDMEWGSAADQRTSI